MLWFTAIAAFILSRNVVMVKGTTKVNISNVEPRVTTDGTWMDIHDGNVLYVNDTFFWFGMGYGNCTETKGLIPPRNCPGIYESFGKGCGFREDHAVRLYASKDLGSWELVSDNVLPLASRPNGIYFRPKVLFNERTRRYVLWINFLPPASTPLTAYPDAVLLVGTATAPEGPYDIVTKKANLSHSGAGDFTVMVDPNSEDQDAYIAYDAWSNSHRVVVEKLTSDYLDSLGSAASTGPLSPSSHEAPVLFERRGVYCTFFAVHLSLCVCAHMTNE